MAAGTRLALKRACDGGLAEDQAARKATVLDVLSEHSVDQLVERPVAAAAVDIRHLITRVSPSTRCRSIASQSQAMPRPGCVRRNSATFHDRHPRRRQAVELRDVFDPAPVRHRRRER